QLLRGVESHVLRHFHRHELVVVDPRQLLILFRANGADTLSVPHLGLHVRHGAMNLRPADRALNEHIVELFHLSSSPSVFCLCTMIGTLLLYCTNDGTVKRKKKKRFLSQ